jgi:hypothetical protein
MLYRVNHGLPGYSEGSYSRTKGGQNGGGVSGTFCFPATLGGIVDDARIETARQRRDVRAMRQHVENEVLRRAGADGRFVQEEAGVIDRSTGEVIVPANAPKTEPAAPPVDQEARRELTRKVTRFVEAAWPVVEEQHERPEVIEKKRVRGLSTKLPPKAVWIEQNKRAARRLIKDYGCDEECIVGHLRLLYERDDFAFLSKLDAVYGLIEIKALRRIADESRGGPRRFNRRSDPPNYSATGGSSDADEYFEERRRREQEALERDGTG